MENIPGLDWYIIECPPVVRDFDVVDDEKWAEAERKADEERDEKPD